MNEDDLEKFGKWFVAEVYDKAVDDMEASMDGRLGGELAESDRLVLSRGSHDCRNIVRVLGPRMMLRVLHQFLTQVEENQAIVLGVRGDDSGVTECKALSDGLSGDLWGWVEEYSRHGDPYRS